MFTVDATSTALQEGHVHCECNKYSTATSIDEPLAKDFGPKLIETHCHEANFLGKQHEDAGGCCF